MPLLLIFIAVPILEIFLFLQVGGAIGTWPTIAIVIVTAIIGTYLVRTQGQQTMTSLKSSMSQMQDPTNHIAHGAMILAAGLLLLTPGFFTDAIGFLLLMPPVRDRIAQRVRARIIPMGGMGGMGGQPGRRDDVVEGEFVDVTPEGQEPDPNAPPSGWTRH